LDSPSSARRDSLKSPSMSCNTILVSPDDYSIVAHPHRSLAESIQGVATSSVSSASEQASASLPAPDSLRASSQARQHEFHAGSYALLGRPPTATQLRELTAVIQGSSASSSSRSRASNRPRGRRQRLASEGQTVSRMYDSLGSRPYPNNGLSLEQSIQLEMVFTTVSIVSSGSTVGATMFGSLSFSLGLFTGATALTTVFDQYRMDQVEIWIGAQTPNQTAAFPVLTTAVDLDDANVPVTTGAVQDKLGAIQSDGPGGHYHKWKPHMAVAAYSGTFTSYLNAPATWIDTASPNVQHFGLKIALASEGTQTYYDLTARAVFSFRAPGIS